MRTTLDIDDDVLAVVKDIAAARKVSAGKVVSEYVRKALTTPGETVETPGVSESPPLEGFEPFPKRGGVVTRELVNRLRDEE